MTYDTIIIGAGAAGLICARDLRKAGLKVLVLEARARPGGRIHTVEVLESPVELGAEFIHSADPAFLKELHDAGIPFIDVCENRFVPHGGKLLKKKDFWEEIQKISKRLRADLKEDRPVAEFLKHKSIKPSMRPLFRSYIEGFHAAHIDRFSEKAMALIEREEGTEINGIKQFRPLTGYAALIRHWAGAEKDSTAWLQLESIVKKVTWKTHHVTVEGSPFSPLETKRLVVTVPLGVLKKNHHLSAIHFEPRPAGLDQALEGAEMGHVERLTLEFSERFWEDLTKEPVGFIQAMPSEYFATWWTQIPRHTPLLTAWQGGPKAEELAHRPVEKQVDMALTTLAKATGLSRSFLQKRLKSHHIHNWGSDPYAFGAYSYITVGGLEKIKRLSRPFDDTLFFAGEATAQGSGQATVHGAAQSGARAARQVLRSLR